MAIFGFDDGGSAANTSASTSAGTASVGFTEEGVNFTLTVTTPGLVAGASFSPGAAAGLVTFFDSTSAANFSLAVNHPTSHDMSNPVVDIQNISSGAWSITFVHRSNTTANFQAPITGPGNITAPAGVYSGIRFTQTSGSGGGISIDTLTATIVCYLEGTGIDTANGQTKVEDLQPGDEILLADGGTTRVKWVGEQPVETRLTHPARVNPIRIAAGAIAENVPARDLFVSPDHAIGIDGMLINASALTNGRSITMVPKMPLEGFTYYHVETEAHEVILAEGCPAESYLDMPDRSGFVNGAERAHVPAIAEMELPRLTTRRMLPEVLIARLEARADQIDARKRRAA